MEEVGSTRLTSLERVTTTPFPKPKWQWKTSANANTFARSLLLPRMQAAALLSTIAINECNLTAEINLPDYLFHQKKAISTIGKCHEILVTAYRTTNEMYWMAQLK